MKISLHIMSKNQSRKHERTKARNNNLIGSGFTVQHSKLKRHSEAREAAVPPTQKTGRVIGPATDMINYH